MKPNMTSVDRIIRSILAITFVILYYKGIVTGTLGIVLIVIAVAFVVTSFISFCPLYTVLGISRKNKKSTHIKG